MYKKTGTTSIYRERDGAYIPADLQNADYAEYIEWCAAGNVAVPAAQEALPDLIEEVRGKINGWRDAQEQAPIVFEHAGRRWDGGLVTRQRLKPVLSLPALPDGFFWTDADNNKVFGLTLADLHALDAAHDAAIVAKGWAIHARQTAMKEEIDTLDANELATYIVGWPEPAE